MLGLALADQHGACGKMEAAQSAVIESLKMSVILYEERKAGDQHGWMKTSWSN